MRCQPDKFELRICLLCEPYRRAQRLSCCVVLETSAFALSKSFSSRRSVQVVTKNLCCVSEGQSPKSRSLWGVPEMIPQRVVLKDPEL